jgi:hypothetical protein
MQYPGRVIKQGEADARIVKALKQALNDKLALQGQRDLKLTVSDPNFGPKMEQAVKMFQARNVDSQGNPLITDGKVASLTWEALFGHQSVPAAATASDDLLQEALRIAVAEQAANVREEPLGSNRGPKVDEYQRRTGLRPGHPWCACFLYWCFDEAAQRLGRPNPVIKTAGCQDHWNRAGTAGIARISASRAAANPELVQPGMIFIMAFDGGFGHTGIVESVAGGFMTTIEGNSNGAGGREGIGVFRLTRKIRSVNKGFIDYSGR